VPSGSSGNWERRSSELAWPLLVKNPTSLAASNFRSLLAASSSSWWRLTSEEAVTDVASMEVGEETAVEVEVVVGPDTFLSQRIPEEGHHPVKACARLMDSSVQEKGRWRKGTGKAKVSKGTVLDEEALCERFQTLGHEAGDN